MLDVTEKEKRESLEGFTIYCGSFEKILDALKEFASREQEEQILELQKKVLNVKEQNEIVLKGEEISEECFCNQKDLYKNMNQEFKFLIECFHPLVRDKFSDALKMFKLGFGFI